MILPECFWRRSMFGFQLSIRVHRTSNSHPMWEECLTAWCLGVRFCAHGGIEGPQAAMPPSGALCFRGLSPLFLSAPQSNRTSYHLRTIPSRCTFASMFRSTFWRWSNLLLGWCSGGQSFSSASFLSHTCPNPRHWWLSIIWVRKPCHPWFFLPPEPVQNLFCSTVGQSCTLCLICFVAGASTLISEWFRSDRSREWQSLDPECPPLLSLQL